MTLCEETAALKRFGASSREARVDVEDMLVTLRNGAALLVDSLREQGMLMLLPVPHVRYLHTELGEMYYFEFRFKPAHPDWVARPYVFEFSRLLPQILDSFFWDDTDRAFRAVAEKASCRCLRPV